MINDYFNVGDVIKLGLEDYSVRWVISSINEVDNSELVYLLPFSKALRYLSNSNYKYYKLNLITNLQPTVLNAILPTVVLDKDDSIVSIGCNTGVLLALYDMKLENLINENTNVDYIKYLNK